MDYALFLFINSLAGKIAFIDNFFIFVSYAGVIIIIILLLLLKNKNLIVKGLAVMALVTLIDLILNFLFYRPRPFAEHEVNLLIQHDKDSSFPSGHAFRSFSLAQLIYFHNKKLGIISLVIAALVAFSRIFIGVHYPSDVLAGVAIGIGGAYLVNCGYDKFIKKK